MEDCVSFREGLYCPNRLQSFQEIIGDPYFHLPFFAQQSLGYEGSFLAGTDIVGLGWAGSGGEILQDQAISSFAYTQPWLAMGLLGLSDQPLNISGPTDLHPSPLGTLLNSERVPSSFWAYNAGARYLDPLVYGRLTFGGFDAARGDVKKGLKVPLGLDNFRDTVVKVTDMTLRVGSDATEAVSIAFDAYIDSVVPELWLPASACSAFESAFSLEWDASAQLYLVDDVLNQALHDQGAEVTLTIADPADLDQNINIHFPYAAFDIEAKYPLAGITDDSTLRYFPLKRANNSDQYTLGRTFLQEAYLAVDYDHSEFYVSQATLSTSSDIKTVHRGGNGLDKGVIAGIAVGSIAAVALILVAAWYFMRVFRPQQKRRRNSRFRARIEAQNADLPDTQVQQPPDDTEMHEYYNTKRPFSPDSDTRQELDASKTARGSIGARAEMESPTPSSMGSPRDKMSPRQSYGFSTSPAELESRSPRMMHSRTASGSSFGQLSPTETLGRRELERTEEAHELP